MGMRTPVIIFNYQRDFRNFFILIKPIYTDFLILSKPDMIDIVNGFWLLNSTCQLGFDNMRSISGSGFCLG
ncbi:hypothetical protein SAMN05421882_1003116 [Nitrosomonas communis]|uniref:Uncharacterized protein n=1 Tax=Nitrosomonas communis TaxID=44574 RepID=A0A1H2R295_9PROT|nr:hypothetical protein SAMN05421882_1003116 [Nitrosomonas communis]